MPVQAREGRGPLHLLPSTELVKSSKATGEEALPKSCKKPCDADVLKAAGQPFTSDALPLPSSFPPLLEQVRGWETGLSSAGKMPGPSPTPPPLPPGRRRHGGTPWGTLRLCLLEVLESATSLTSLTVGSVSSSFTRLRGRGLKPEGGGSRKEIGSRWLPCVSKPAPRPVPSTPLTDGRLA